VAGDGGAELQGAVALGAGKPKQADGPLRIAHRALAERLILGQAADKRLEFRDHLTISFLPKAENVTLFSSGLC